MKCLRRNMTEFLYYGYTGLDSDLNEDGLHTGIWKPIYREPVAYSGNISVPSGAVAHSFDGIDVRYSHVLVMDNPELDINEAGYIEWKNRKYDITAVRPSLNTLTIALRQRTEDHGDQYTETEGDA